MATFNSANGTVQAFNKSLIEMVVVVPPTGTVSFGNNVTSNTVTVTTSATLFIAANTNHLQTIISNPSTNTVYLGGPGVTVSNGYPLQANTDLDISSLTGALYVVAAATGSTVSYLAF